MPGHGGARENSGPKPTWEHLPADETIRVPRALKGDLKRIAHVVDELVARGVPMPVILRALETLEQEQGKE